MAAAWTVLVAPFAKDMGSMVLVTWNSVDWRARLLGVLSIFVLFGMFKAFQVKHLSLITAHLLLRDTLFFVVRPKASRDNKVGGLSG